MKRRKRPTLVILYNLILIVVFFVVYLLFADHFITSDRKKPEVIDILNLSVTLQTSVGFSTLSPVTNTGKIILLIQQTFLIFGNLIILHFMIM
jgi:hypothetical protein